MWLELEQQSQCSRVYNVICHSGEDLWTPLERDTLHTVVYACWLVQMSRFKTIFYLPPIIPLSLLSKPDCMKEISPNWERGVCPHAIIKCGLCHHRYPSKFFIGWTSLWNSKIKGLIFFFLSYCRSIHRLSQLERLDLGSNEFSELVRKMFSYWTLFINGTAAASLSLYPAWILALVGIEEEVGDVIASIPRFSCQISGAALRWLHHALIHYSWIGSNT